MFYPLMKKAGYGLPGKDAIVVWWGALRGAIGLALPWWFTRNLRYEFQSTEGGADIRIKPLLFSWSILMRLVRMQTTKT